MAIRRKQNWLGQQRVDLAHLKSVESAVSNDFDELIAGLIVGENKSYVVRGFNINMPGSIGGSANGLQLIVEDSSFLHGASNESGTFFTIPIGTPAEVLSSTTNDKVEGSFTPNTDNYIGIEFVRKIDDSTVDQVYFWNPTNNVENTRNVPLAIIMDYKIVISTSSFASNVMPVSVVQTDSANNVVSITDRRPLLFRLGTAGDNEPNPFYSYPWDNGRNENFYTSTSSSSDPFAGGDKQLKNMKEFFDALMTEFKNLKGTPYWYSPSAGSILRVRQDIANTAFTGKGNVTHGLIDFRGQVAGMTTDVIIKQSGFNGVGPITLTADSIKDIDTLISDWNAANSDNQVVLFSGDGTQVPTGNIVLTSKAGQINWNSNIFLNFIGGRLRYKINKNEATDDLTLADNEVAYLNLVRGVDVTPNIVFTNGGTVVTSVGAVNWTTDLQAGDFIKDASKGDENYYEIASVDSLSQVTLTEPFGETSSGPAGFDAQYAFGVYETNPSPSTPRHVQIADRGSVPFDENYFWLFFRKDDTGSLSKIYARATGGQEIEQGESQNISDNTSLAVLNYIGSASESDSDPDYSFLADNAKTGTENFNTGNGENLTIRASKLTSMMADKAQDKTIKLVSDHTTVNNVVNGGNPLLQDITFSGGSGSATVAMPSSPNNGTIGLTGTLELAENQVAFFNVDRNTAFSLATLDSLTVTNIDSVALGENTFIFAYRLTGSTVYLWDNSVLETGTSISLPTLTEHVRQNKTVKLVKGGTWSWDLATNTLNNSAAAYIQVAGLAENVNEIAAQNIVLAADGEVAYVTLKRTAGASTLAVTVADIASVPETDDTFIIARRNSNEVVVGTNSFKLADEEFLTLDGALQEINRYNGQLNVLPHNPLNTRVRVTSSDIAKLSGSTISLEQTNLLLTFEGVEIDFATGEVFEIDGTTPFLGGANDFTPFTIPSGEFFYYSISVLPNETNADNTISGQVLVIPATESNAVLANTLKAPFPAAGLKLANVLVQEDGLGSILPIDYANIIQLSIGGTGSGGSGGGPSFLQDLKFQLKDSNYGFLTASVFSDEQDAKLSNSDGAYSFSQRAWSLEAGQFLTTINLLTPRWYTDELSDIGQIDLTVKFKETIDDLATYETSIDGGNNWQTISMERIGESDTFVKAAFKIDDSGYTFATVSEFADSNTDGVVELNASNQQRLSQSFVTNVDDYWVGRELSVYLSKLGSPTGNVFVSIIKDDGGSPSLDANDIVFKSDTRDISLLVGGSNTVTFTVPYLLLEPNTRYHILFETDTVYKANFTTGVDALRVNADTTSANPEIGQAFDGTTYSALAGTSFTYLLKGRVLDLRIRITASQAALLDGFGVFYGLEENSQASSRYPQEIIYLNGDDNVTIIPISQFNVNPDTLLLSDLDTGQSWLWPAFSFAGNNIQVPSGTFDRAGETIRLKAILVGGGTFSNDENINSQLAENHLGSLNSNQDKSVSGRGFILRNAAGQLVEVALDEFNNLTFTIL